MYTSDDIQTTTRQINRRMTLLAVPTLLLLIGLVISLLPAVRLEWLTVTLTIVLGAMLIFVGHLMIVPLLAYRRFLHSALTGRTHPLDVTFKSLTQEACLRDRVYFYPMLVSEGDPANEKDDRLFYFDIEKPLPNVTAGTSLHIVYHDKAIVDYKII